MPQALAGYDAAVDNGWQDSADAWIADQGEHGDFGRRYVLMLPRALDVGCGEGRFCRLLMAGSRMRLSTYMSALLQTGLVLTHCDEPGPSHDTPASRAAAYRRVPWFVVMEWLTPTGAGVPR